MKKMLCALAALLTFGAGQAAADSFTPAGATTRFSGTVRLDHGALAWFCTLVIQVQANGAGTGALVTAVNVSPSSTSPTGPACNFYPFSTPFILDATSLTTLDIQNMYVTPGMAPTPCGPTTLTVDWNGVGQTLSFVNDHVGPIYCLKINGVLTRISGPSLTITP